MKYTILFFIYCFSLCFGIAQNIGDPYIYEYPELLSNSGNLTDLEVDYDGGFFIMSLKTENNLGQGETPRELIAKVSRDLELLYSRHLYVDNFGTTDYYFVIRDLKPLSNGEILIGGELIRDSWGIQHIFTLKLDVNGNLAWFRRFASIEYKLHRFYHFYVDESNPDYFYYGAFYFISEDPDDLINYEDRDLFLVKADLSNGLSVSYTPMGVYGDIGFAGSHSGNVHQDRFNSDEFFLDVSMYPFPLEKLTQGFIKFNTEAEILQTHHIGREEDYDTIPYIPSLTDTIPFYTQTGEMAQLPSGNITYLAHGRGIIYPDSAGHGFAAHYLKLNPDGEVLDIKGVFPPESEYHVIGPLELELFGDSLLFAGGRIEPMYSPLGDYGDLGILKLDTNGNVLDSLMLPIYKGWVVKGFYSDSSGLYIGYNGYKSGNNLLSHYIARIDIETMTFDTLKATDFGHDYQYLADSTYNKDDILIHVTKVIGIPDLSGDVEIGLYPNPAQDYIGWSLPDVVRISVNDMKGRVLIQQQVTESRLDISELPSGTYTILFTDSSDKQAIGKFVVD